VLLVCFAKLVQLEKLLVGERINVDLLESQLYNLLLPFVEDAKSL